MRPLRELLKQEAALAIPLCGVLIAFTQVLGFDFVSWDDPTHVTENPLLLGEGTWKEHLLTPAFGYPIPLTILSYQIEVALAGMQPALMHLTNLLLHCLNVTLLYSILRRLQVASILAALSVVPLALHPSVSEPVAWITGRKDLLALCFVLAALLVQLVKQDWKGHLAAVALGVCALLSKPVAVFVAPVALAFSWQVHKESFRALLAKGVTWCMAIAPVVLLAYVGQDKAGALSNEGNVSAIDRVLFAAGFHSKLLLLAQEPTAKYLPAWPPEFGMWQGIAIALLIVALAALYFFRDKPLVIVGLIWAGAAYLPSSNLVPLTRIAADSYLYPSLAGLGIALGSLKHAPVRVKAWWAVSVGATLCFTLLSLPAVAKWHDSVSLWSHAYTQYPEVRICNNVGIAQLHGSEVKKGLMTLEACLRAHGPNLKVQKNMAIGFYLDGDKKRALAAFNALHKTHPEDPTINRWLRRLGTDNPDDQQD